ncbi:MAG TPA: GDSL-type esterase/lipase family protein [Archangium sp.]|jgi:lysophospholipase L1-like esterase|uniref:GDSL-type esterase/lipase family protein n=1 Tax=Archangium sp. TaxID=1872627 RepID=UPI002EDA9394
MKTPTLITLATALGLSPMMTTPACAEAPHSSVALRTPIRYAALGASDTVGVGSRTPTRENWTARIHAALPGNTVYERFARSGITLGEAVKVEVPRAIAFRPTLVTMWLSVNDALGHVPLPTYQKSLQATLERLTRETEAQVVLLNVPDLAALAPGHASPQARAQLRETASAWNAAIAAAARPYGQRVLVVDLVPASKELPQHASWLSSDGFHPSPEGYQKLADLTLEAMHRAGLLPTAEAAD